MSQYVQLASPPAVTAEGWNTASRSRLFGWPTAVQYWSIQMNRLIDGAYLITWSQHTPPSGLSAYIPPTPNEWNVTPPSTDSEIFSLLTMTTFCPAAATLGSLGVPRLVVMWSVF